MVKESVATTYRCEACDARYDTKSEAEKCERQKPKPIALRQWSKTRTAQQEEKKDWKVGDVVAWPGNGPMFGKIVGTRTERHYILPIYASFDGTTYPEKMGLGFSFTLWMGKEEAKQLLDAINLRIGINKPTGVA